MGTYRVMAGAAICLSLLGSSVSLARGVTVGDIMDAVRTDDVAAAILSSAARAFDWSNTLAQTNGHSLYCQPVNLRLGQKEYIAIMESYLVDRPQVRSMSANDFQFHFLNALMDRFPC